MKFVRVRNAPVPPRSLNTLPPEVITHIASFLSPVDCFQWANVNKGFRALNAGLAPNELKRAIAREAPLLAHRPRAVELYKKSVANSKLLRTHDIGPTVYSSDTAGLHPRLRWANHGNGVMVIGHDSGFEFVDMHRAKGYEVFAPNTKDLDSAPGSLFASITGSTKINLIRPDFVQRTFASLPGFGVEGNTDPQVGHVAEVTSIAFSSTGNELVSGDQAGAVLIWDVKTQSVVAKLDLAALHPDEDTSIQQVRFSPCDRFFLVQSRGGRAEVRDAQSGAGVIELKANVRMATFSPDGLRIVACYDNGQDPVIMRQSFGLVLKTHRRKAQSWKGCFFSADGSVVGVHTETELFLWDARSGAFIRKLPAQPNGYRLQQMLLSPAGDFIITAVDIKGLEVRTFRTPAHAKKSCSIM